jgi:hypothetical protein
VADEDHEYLAWLRKQACCLCECPFGVHAHHHTHGAVTQYEAFPGALTRARGKSQRAHDSWAMPLCVKCHLQLHSLSGRFRGWVKEQLRTWQTERVSEYRAIYAALKLDDVF